MQHKAGLNISDLCCIVSCAVPTAHSNRDVPDSVTRFRFQPLSLVSVFFFHVVIIFLEEYIYTFESRNVFTFDTSHYILQFNMAATTILVVGATGKQGGQVMATLLNSGRSQISLRFLTRNKSSPNATELISKGATAVVGNLSDRQLLLTALKGVNRAYLVTDAGAGEEKEAELGINFVEAAKEAGVSHMVLSSVSAADLAKDVPHFRSKATVSLRS